MRLLRIEADGGFSLVEYVGKSIPPYAILSHTWGEDHEEVTVRDIIEGSGRNKAGYAKLIFCGKQAAKNDLQFFWIDTCCIDKTSSAEFSEAINSMFRWYQDAARCYVFLSDVSIRDVNDDRRSIEKSKWFTRGWTLQELLAPTSVEFFDQEGDRIGDKDSLMSQITTITGIPTSALQGSPLSQFSVEVKRSWLGDRQTKRVEDAAYCLLGIFNVFMPLIYGEGRERAFIRLWEEINKPFYDLSSALSSQAPFTEPMNRKTDSFSVPFRSIDPDTVDQPGMSIFKANHNRPGRMLRASGDRFLHRRRRETLDLLVEGENQGPALSNTLVSVRDADNKEQRMVSRLRNIPEIHDRFLALSAGMGAEKMKDSNQQPLLTSTRSRINTSISSGPIIDQVESPQRAINTFSSFARFIDFPPHLLGQPNELGEHLHDEQSQDETRGISIQAAYRLMLDVEYVSKVQSQSTINDWLGVTKLNDQHNVTQYYDKQTSSRLEGTCNWIFSHRSYESWISEDNPNETARILWICAPAGYGKTVLCARLVEHLKAMHSFPVAYFFASPHAQSGGEPSFILRSWIAQIAQLDSDVLEFVQEHLDAGQRASESSVWSIFATIVSANRNYTFVLDGFDEYSREDNIRATFLHKLKDVTGGTLSRILIASRKETDIEAELSPGKAEVAEYVLLQCKITKTDIWSDISLFSKCVVDEKLPKKDDRLRQDLAGQLAEKCEGMFLWIRLQKDQLRGSKNTKQLQNIVKDMPIGLIKTYERNWKTLQNHSPADRDRAFAILRWATFALRPLTVSEITEALIVRSDNDGTTPQWDELPDNIDDEYINSEIIDICGGLVETRAEKPGSEARFRTIHLIHPSVREFLLPTLSPSSMDISQPYAERSQAPSQAEQHEYLTTICLGYLKCDETWGKYALNKDSEHKDGFIDYAAVNWNKHMLLAGKENAMPLRLLEEFFHPENKSFKQWRMYIEPPFGKANAAQGKIEPLATPLYYAALFDLTSSMEHIRDRDPSQLNRVGGEFGTPLQAACFKGNESAFRLLCDWGADPNVQGGRFKVPINAAIAGGQTSMAEALIRMDVDHTLQDSYGRSPVFLAANNGSTKIVKQLIEKGANIAVPSLYGWTPLSSAADRGQVEVAKLLLEKGADIEVRSQDGWTPLNLATSSGHLEVVQLLFEKGADIATSTNTGSTPLITAADRGHLEVIKLLLEKGADVTVTNLNGWTPLNAAARNGHTEVVKLLLEKCANVDVTNYQNWTPLNCAACGGYIEAVKLLLEKGSDVATVNKDGWTPLNSAANSGHLEVVKILLEHGADVTIANNEGGTPLNTAANGGYVEVVKLLLENGADISVPNKNGWTPLNSAAGKGYIEIVKLLLQNGADVAAANNDSWTPLNSAADRGYVKIVKPPLEKGDDLSTAKNHGWTPLNSAANNGHIEVIKQLLEHGADMNRVGIHGWTPLNTAATNGHVEVVKLLLEKGADTTIANEDGWTPLNAAANNGHFETVKVLLEQGADSALAENDWTPLNTAATNGHVKIVKLLLENGADVNLANKEGWTPLEFAAFSGYSEIAKLLIEKEANTSISESGWMALSLAANYGHIEVIKLLLENGPDLAAVGKSGWTSLNAAANNDHVEATKLLLEHGAYAALNGLDPHFGTIFNLFAFKGYTDLLPFCYEKRNSPVLYPNDNHGRSPIHLAVRGGHIGTFQHLIRLGLDPTAKDANGDGLLCYASSGGSLEVLNAVWDQDSQSTPESNSWSPLHWACRAGVPEVVEALIEKGIRADCVTVPEREGKWSPLSIAIFHGHENMLGKLSASHKSLLAVDDSAMKTPGERHGGYWCDRCLHEIYGARYHCRTCKWLDYCFMCKPLFESLHEQHDMEFVESYV